MPRKPSPATVRARELATPTTTAAELVARLAAEGLTLDARRARAIVAAARAPAPADDQRVADTRATLLHLAGERTLDAPPWRQVVADRLGISTAAVGKAYRKGVSLATRERWMRDAGEAPAK